MLTQESLQELFNYNPETGIFTRLKSNSNRAKVGDISGTMSNGYLQIKVNGKAELCHRLAYLYMVGSFPPNDIDHRNGIRNDNRWNNLRPATRQENCRNRKVTSKNSSGVIGVCWDRNKMKWVSHCMIDGKHKHVGYFNNIAEAENARNKYIKFAFGQFAHNNDVNTHPTFNN